MSAALVAARDAARKAAQALRSAEGQHAAEVAAVAERNEQRRRDFWAGGALADAQGGVGRLDAARASFRDAVAAGDGADVLTAYLAYARTMAEEAGWTHAAQSAHPDTGESYHDTLELGPMHGHVVSWNDPPSLADMLTAVLPDISRAQGDAYRDAKLAPLRSELEPDPDEGD